jgi:glycine C-acetyltransferase
MLKGTVRSKRNLKTFREELELLKDQGLYRRTCLVRGSQQARVGLEGREVLLFCSNNYLGLADHPLLKEAVVRAVEKYGVSSGASRLVSGTMELHEALEKRIAEFKGTEAALVFNSGYAANTGIIPALTGKGDVIFSDRLNHASILDGCLLSRAKLVRYPHKDIRILRRLLAENETAGRRLIVTDGVFSMDGDLAPLPELVALKKESDALLMVDDAHGTGVLGPGGRGTAEHFGLLSEIDIHMGTLGKALGSFGAYAAASRDIIEYLVNRARSFIFSTSLPPSVLAASIAAFDLVDSPEGLSLREKLAENVEYFRSALQTAGFDTMGSETQIVPVFVGEPEPVMEFSRLLLDKGIYVQGIRPPTVPTGSCRLRCTLMAVHVRPDLEQAVEAVIRAGKQVGVIS